MQLRSLCFTSFVFGGYQKYIPYFIYSVLRTYPESFVKIFIDGTLNAKVAKGLNVLTENGFHHFSVNEHNFTDLNLFEKYRINGGSKKLFRWLFEYNHFKDFKYIYHGDIDILIMPEKKSLLETHVEQIITNKVPFSNMVRVNDKKQVVRRLTGLHFIETKPYYAKMDTIIKRLFSDIEFRHQMLAEVKRDEHLLFELNKQAFDFDEKKLAAFRRPIHGLHLGFLRKTYDKKEIRKHLNWHQCSLSPENLKLQLELLYSEKTFQKLNRIIFLKEIYLLNKYLNIRNTTFFRIVNFKEEFLTPHKLKQKLKQLIRK